MSPAHPTRVNVYDEVTVFLPRVYVRPSATPTNGYEDRYVLSPQAFLSNNSGRQFIARDRHSRMPFTYSSEEEGTPAIGAELRGSVFLLQQLSPTHFHTAQRHTARGWNLFGFPREWKSDASPLGAAETLPSSAAVGLSKAKDRSKIKSRPKTVLVQLKHPAPHSARRPFAARLTILLPSPPSLPASRAHASLRGRRLYERAHQPGVS